MRDKLADICDEEIQPDHPSYYSLADAIIEALPGMVEMEWDYGPNYGYIARAKTPFGYYTICADEDRLGEPLFLEFHHDQDGYCTRYAEDIVLSGSSLEGLDEFQAAATADYTRRILSALGITHNTGGKNNE